MRWLALCFGLLPLSAGAEETRFLAVMIDTLARPDLSAPDVVAGMQAAGLELEATVTFRAEGATANAEDPYY